MCDVCYMMSLRDNVMLPRCLLAEGSKEVLHDQAPCKIHKISGISHVSHR